LALLFTFSVDTRMFWVIFVLFHSFSRGVGEQGKNPEMFLLIHYRDAVINKCLTFRVFAYILYIYLSLIN